MTRQASKSGAETFPRGAIKAFRQYLNRRFAGEANWKNGRYEQRTQGYGDYLYRQDRAKFNVELSDALGGSTNYPGFVWTEEVK